MKRHRFGWRLTQTLYTFSSASDTDALQVKTVPSRIDLLTSIWGCPTNEAFASYISAILDGIPVFLLGKDTLIAVGRPEDLADLAALEV